MSTITSRPSTTPSPNSDPGARRRYWLAIATVAAVVMVAYICFGGSHWQRNESWIPGTVSRFDLPELMPDESYHPIRWAFDLQQPIVAQSGSLAERGANLFAVDRSRFARSLLRPVQAGGWVYQNVVDMWRGAEGETIAVLWETTGHVPVSIPESGPIRFAKSIALNQRVWLNPDCYGCDSETFVVAADRQLRLHVRRTGEPTGEVLTLPFEPDGCVYKTADGSFIGLERTEGTVMIHSTGRPSLTFDRSEIATLSRIDDDAYFLSSRRRGFQKLRVDIESLTTVDSPLKTSGHVIAIDERLHRFLVANYTETFTYSAFRGSGVKVAATLALVDYNTWQVVASQEVEFIADESDWQNCPWTDAVFAPDQDRLWVLNHDCSISEIDVAVWIAQTGP